MEPNRLSKYRQLAYPILELISVLCMICAAAETGRLLLSAEWDPAFFLFFCAIFGGLSAAGRCAGQEKLSFLASAAAALLSLAVFRYRQAGWEVWAALAAWYLGCFVHTRDRLRQLFIAAETAGLIACFLSGRPVQPFLAALVLLLLLQEWVSSPGRPRRAQGLFLLPFLLLLTAAVFAIPVRDEPYDWQFAVNLGRRAADSFRGLQVELEYLFSSAGLSGSWGSGYGLPDLSGGLFAVKSREELFVQSRSTRTNLYLTGEEYATFSENRWTVPSGADSPDLTMPLGSWYPVYLNALYQRGVSREMAACFSHVCSLDLTYRLLRTRDVFRPACTLGVDAFLERDMAALDNRWTFKKSRGNGYRYRVSFMDFDYANPYLADILSHAGEFASEPWPDYDALSAYSASLYSLSLADVISREDYDACLGSLQEPDLTAYLDTGETTDRVRALASQLTEGCANDFARCRAVESYLRQYPYSTDVSYDGYVDFTDAFLFEKQTGYCVHYASAMVLLLRAAGVPARLAEGYFCDYSLPGEQGGYVLMGDQAHVWPEAYINGYGWVRFEPTAIRPDASATGWNLLLPEEPEPSEEETAGTRVPAVPLPPALSEPSPEETPKIVETSPSETVYLRYLTAAGFLALIPVLYLALLVTVLPFARNTLYRRKNGRDRLETDIKDLCFLIRCLYPVPAPDYEEKERGASGWQNRPLLDYAGALEDESLRRTARQVFLSCYRCRYRGESPSEEDIGNATRLKDALCRQYVFSKKKGKPFRRLRLLLNLSAFPRAG